MNRDSRGHAFSDLQEGNGGWRSSAPAVGAGSDLQRGITVNQIARNVWDMMGENKTIAQISSIVADRFGLDREAALVMTREIIASFQARKTIVSRSC